MNRIISPMVRETLKQQDECPQCHVSWLTLEDSLNTSIDSPDWYIALSIIRNCDICMMRFAKEFQIMVGDKE